MDVGEVPDFRIQEGGSWNAKGVLYFFLSLSLSGEQGQRIRRPLKNLG